MMWKPIKGYEGLYEVSDTGKVRSLNRQRTQISSHGTLMIKKFYGKEITPHNNGNGYQYVSLHSDKRKNHYVHRLVAEAFVDNPCGYDVVNHIDKDKSNNNSANLEWVTVQQNVLWSSKDMQKPKSRYKKTMTGEKYITKRKGKYRLSYRSKPKGISFDKLFETLEEAIAKRKELGL